MSEAIKRRQTRRAFLKMTALGSLAGASVALGADSQKTMRPATAQELQEKALLYVAVSRASDLLYLTTSENSKLLEFISSFVTAKE